MTRVRLIACALTVLAAGWMAMPRLLARQVTPGAPSGLTYLVRPGGGVELRWLHSTGPFTHYVLEAGGAPGETFFRFPTSAFYVGNANSPGYYFKLPELVAAFTASGIGAGDYHVRIKAANGAVESAPSNEVIVPVRAGCHPPGTPTNFTVINRGTLGLLMWNPGSGGAPTTYIVQAAGEPNHPAPPIQIPLNTPYFTLDIPVGTFYVRIAAVNACGISAASSEVVITSPSTSPARTPDPPPGQRLPQPYVRDLVAQFAAQARGLGYLNPQTACPPRAGSFVDPTEARKTQRNAYIDYIVSRLRLIDQRFGFNAKPTRAWVPSIIAGDEITYHFGSDPSEGSPNIYIVDVLGGHCTGIDGSSPDRHSPDYRTFYDEFGRWTLAGLTP